MWKGGTRSFGVLSMKKDQPECNRTRRHFVQSKLLEIEIAQPRQSSCTARNQVEPYRVLHQTVKHDSLHMPNALNVVGHKR